MSDADDLVDGRFRLQRLLVQTNLSQVWFARDVRFGRRVVIKAPADSIPRPLHIHAMRRLRADACVGTTLHGSCDEP
ncbi:hypothetical protein HaLaN_21771 [Haematococcus lacustris]|uniref:Uncharacterized protein n=1 Tax=Haematococcus lacustris TaxID=44745 RepID=A0A699ZZ68_HAELA|nr:hypothetical protein HaLaN_21771 [Haematococcus lacustris]